MGNKHNRYNRLLPAPTCCGLVTDLSFMLRTCYRETGVMDFGLNNNTNSKVIVLNILVVPGHELLINKKL